MTLEEFVATKQRMSSHAYGNLVGDAAWEDEPPVTPKRRNGPSFRAGISDARFRY